MSIKKLDSYIIRTPVNGYQILVTDMSYLFHTPLIVLSKKGAYMIFVFAPMADKSGELIQI